MSVLTKLALVHSGLDSLRTQCVLVGVFSSRSVSNELKELDRLYENRLVPLLSKDLFDGEFNSFKLVPNPLNSIQNVLLVGLGDPASFSIESLRRISASAAQTARAANAREIVSLLHLAHSIDNSPAERLKASALAMGLGLYQFTPYKTMDLDKIKRLDSLRFFVHHDDEAGRRALFQAQVLLENVSLARNLVNTPSNDKTPPVLAKYALSLVRKRGLAAEVFAKKKLERLGMNSFLSVNKGSSKDNPAQLVRIEYAPKKAQKTVSVIGKGITFDTGGINLKPWEGMLEMKLDMAGAAAALGIVLAAADLKLSTRVIAYLVLTENLPSPKASRPMDVVKAYNGKTIEILHTDAEGRLVLADALSYSEANDKPDVLVDLATLTGAAIVALGRHFSGILGNDESLLAKFKAAGEKSGEWVWPLPLTAEYKDQVKSPVADVQNLTKFRGEGGTIIGAAFLSYFVEKTPWVHIDIASTAFFRDGEPTRTYWTKGATGVGIQLVTEWLASEEKSV